MSLFPCIQTRHEFYTYFFYSNIWTLRRTIQQSGSRVAQLRDSGLFSTHKGSRRLPRKTAQQLHLCEGGASFKIAYNHHLRKDIEPSAMLIFLARASQLYTLPPNCSFFVSLIMISPNLLNLSHFLLYKSLQFSYRNYKGPVFTGKKSVNELFESQFCDKLLCYLTIGYWWWKLPLTQYCDWAKEDVRLKKNGSYPEWSEAGINSHRSVSLEPVWGDIKVGESNRWWGDI